MKGIFSKTGNKKDISGKMDRRGILSPSGSSTTNQSQLNHSLHSQQNGRGVNSFIPTSATYHVHSNGHPGKNAHTVAMQQQQQQQHHAAIPNGVMQSSNHFYSNIAGNNHSSAGTLGTRQEHHYTNYQQSIHHSQHSSQQIQQRTLTKSYSSSHNQQSHYGNTTGYANNNNANQNTTYYGNTTNSTNNGAVIINGHHGGEKSVINSHHNPVGMNQVQHSYINQQVHHHQHNMQQIQNVQQLQQQGQSQRTHHQPHQNSQIQQSNSTTTTTNNSNNNNNHNNNNINPNATDGLPPTLVESMRTLFDILDDSKQGKIRLSDIETRWESDSNGINGKNSGAEPLIKMGVLEYLRKVTPSDGLLTFDRFCSGLRLALLTNNNESNIESNVKLHLQSDKMQYQQQNPPQQYFQEHVRNLTNTTKVSQNQSGPPPPPPVYNMNPPNLGNKSSSAILLPSTGQSNTIHRFTDHRSKIPNLSASRLPMPNGGVPSGIPLSPNNRLGPFSSSNGGKPTTQTQHNTICGNPKRYPTNSEQGTTVALVHPQPPPNPKPISNGGIGHLSAYPSLGGTLKITKQSSNSGFQNRYSSKNSSLDDLQATNAEQGHLDTNQKERPPSAPILDNDPDDNIDGHEYYPSKQRIRERAKSQERDRVVSNSNNNNNTSHNNKADEKSNFVKSRQRTLSMPQLQLNKLKPKSSAVNFESSPPEKIIPPPKMENNYPRPSALKNNSHSHTKLPTGSSIPTVSLTNSLKHTKNESNSKDNNTRMHEKESHDLPPPPPKPPRNAMNGPGPVTISTTLVNGVTQDPPLSGSSFESGQSSSATISLSASSSSGGNSSKPEIRNVLHSWQKTMTDKKPVEPSLSVTSITTNTSINTNDTTKSAPPINTEKAKLTNGLPNHTTSDEVKLRANSKSNLKRKDTSRRHTVQSGIDFSMLKRLKQLEQERDVLQQGLSYLEKSHDWYVKQLETADDKIGQLSKGAPTADYWSESHEERLNLLGCRISEVNTLLTALMDGSSQVHLHMNLQIPSHLSLRTITRLKDQNRQLTQEVSDYSHRVTQLENEKAMLLRQLFHQKNNSTSDETVYM